MCFDGESGRSCRRAVEEARHEGKRIVMVRLGLRGLGSSPEMFVKRAPDVLSASVIVLADQLESDPARASAVEWNLTAEQRDPTAETHAQGALARMPVAVQQRCIVVRFGEADRPLAAIGPHELLAQVDP